ncbi:iron ABC transporter permease [Pontibacillus sp. HN14]|uniref:Iron ABC transporter permease n=2 Tax=Bacillaceae TaxID=186817 RepID=A0ABY8V3F6_9BACI|nr:MULTISPECIES: iron ABC transporter permease [Pontibacillus]MCD5322318.1 iron ABC transporter permease [Pontibacillus sp. HN14]WIG00161.1 iron ABC transporter permease [Pontibacillus chungwhensis]
MTMKKQSFPIQLITGIALCGLSFILALRLGAADLTFHDILLTFTTNVENEATLLLSEIRIPREVGAIAVGAALAVSGAIMQGLTKNPLADPGLLGLTSGANMALAIALALIPGANYIWITVACFMGAAIGAGLVMGIGSMKRGGFSPFRIVLAGAAVSAFLTAIGEFIGLYFHVSKDITMWTAGGLMGTSWSQLQFIIPFIILGVVVALVLSKQLTILSLNEELAVGLGQKVTFIKLALFAVVVILAGAAVALVGNMVFIGLMIPHMVRAMVGTDYRLILPMSIFVGSAFMLIADTAGRTINAPYETPVAAIIALLGLPFFLVIVKKGGRTFS